MDVFTVVAPVFATNCSVIALPSAVPTAPSTGRTGDVPRDCVVVDAGAGVAQEVTRVVEQEGLAVRAVLATHGHVDHTWDAAELCARYDVPLWLHAADVYRIADPFGSIEPAVPGGLVSGPLGQALTAAGARPQDYHAPSDVRELAATSDAVRVHRFGDIVLGALHAPGHTQGSTLYLVGAALTPGQDGVAPDDLSARPGDVVLTGDVLFAGTIGRTDLPGGDGATMARTLRDVVGRLDDAWQVLPGHGPASTMARERRTNPFLARDPGTRPPLG